MYDVLQTDGQSEGATRPAFTFDDADKKLLNEQIQNINVIMDKV